MMHKKTPEHFNTVYLYDYFGYERNSGFELSSPRTLVKTHPLTFTYLTRSDYLIDSNYK